MIKFKLRNRLKKEQGVYLFCLTPPSEHCGTPDLF